jgi:predicted CXXCH cytochrome family protein
MKPVNPGTNHVPFAEGECLSCHDAHASNIRGMVTKNEAVLCATCHSDLNKNAKDAKSTHAPYADGDCTKCHSPHKAKLNKLLLAQSPDLCFNCHKTIKTKVNTEKPHSPAQKDCSTCHLPHLSKEKKLIVEPLQAMCAECHEPGKPGFIKAHLGINASDMDCMTCHDPHASKDPKFFKSVVHPPFAGRTCDDCHIKQ